MRYKKFYKQIAPLLKQGDFFLNLGANDGVTNDPIYDFIEPFQLKGIAVEPIAASYQKLCENYSKSDGVTLERAAIYEGKKLPIYRLPDDILLKYPVLTQAIGMDRQTLVNGLENFRCGNVDPTVYKKIDRHALAGVDSIADLLIVDESITFMTFEELMIKHNVQQIDFLDLDIEGYDFDVFMAIDLCRWKPKVIGIETAYFTGDQHSALMVKLKTAGYKFLQRFEYYSEIFVKAF